MKKELIRLEKMRSYEKKYQEAEYICGIDEVGRGPLAGPVVTCAVILPKDCRIPYIKCPKNFPKKRERSLHRS